MWSFALLKPQHFQRIFRRFYYEKQFKPKDRHVLADGAAAENFAAKDVILFRYENPRKVMITNLAAGVASGLAVYQAYFAWKLKSDLDPLKERISDGDKSFVAYRNFNILSKFFSAGMLTFGCGLGLYWIMRNMYLVRRVILRKGGRHVTIVTYGTLGVSSRTTTVPLTHVIMV